MDMLENGLMDLKIYMKEMVLVKKCERRNVAGVLR